MTDSKPSDNGIPQPRRELSLIDSTSIIVGIIIGSAVYEIAPRVASGVGGFVGADWAYAATIGVWVLGGLVALVGAMCYAELATAYPHAGGTYVYLSEALGRTVGFGFAWVEFWIVRPGNVGAVAFVLARYGEQLVPERMRGAAHFDVWLAAGAVVVLAAVNAMGLRAGKGVQNLLTACKVLGLVAIVAVSLTVSPPAQVQPPVEFSSVPFAVALIQIMFAYGGWADMSFVAAEIRHPQRNIFRALLAGTCAVTAIYVAVNAAFLHALGMEGVARSEAVAADVLSLRLGGHGAQAISALVVISCLGAVNGMLLTGARVFYALGTHHAIFRWLGAWNDRTGVPLRSLALQTIVTLGLVIGFGRQARGFERLVIFTAPFYWGFIALVGVALIVLRSRAATREATYRVPFYPLTPLIFIVTSGAMVYAAIDYAMANRSSEAWWAIGVAAMGTVVGIVDWRARHR
jgi:basic amino acid/polyamine antiporter, APA family